MIKFLKYFTLTLLLFSLMGCSEQTNNETNNDNDDKKTSKEKFIDKLMGTWKLEQSYDIEEDIVLDKYLQITEDNILNGLGGMVCFDNQGNRDNECSFVQYDGSEKNYQENISISFSNKNTTNDEYFLLESYRICFKLEDDKLIQNDCTSTYLNNGGIETNYNITYVKTDEEVIEDDDLTEIPDGYLPYKLAVDLNSTFGNSIMPNSKIDLYIHASNNGENIFGIISKNLTVLSVLDKNGNDVFNDNNENTPPAFLVLSLPEEQYNVLMKAETIPSIKMVPVPTGYSYTNKNSTLVTTEELNEFIKNYSN